MYVYIYIERERYYISYIIVHDVVVHITLYHTNYIRGNVMFIISIIIIIIIIIIISSSSSSSRSSSSITTTTTSTIRGKSLQLQRPRNG